MFRFIFIKFEYIIKPLINVYIYFFLYQSMIFDTKSVNVDKGCEIKLRVRD